MTIKISGSLDEKDESLIEKGGGSLNFVLKEMMPPLSSCPNCLNAKVPVLAEFFR